MSDLTARLGKHGAILCGWPDCGRKLAEVSTVTGHPMALLTSHWTRREDGTWVVDPDDRVKLRRGLRLKDKRRWKETDSPNFIANMSWVFPEVPGYVKCPFCDQRQLLDPAKLKVEQVDCAQPAPDPWDHFGGYKQLQSGKG